jgi:hypothetical protein
MQKRGYIEIDRKSHVLEIVIDTNAAPYSEHICGEGADICLYRDMDTDKVVGCRLPITEDIVFTIDNLLADSAGP